MREAFYDDVLLRWRGVGVAYCGPIAAAVGPSDLETLLLDTARALPHVARLSNTTVTWLSRFGALVAQHRLCRLVTDRLDPVDQAPLGVVLEQAQAAEPSLDFHAVLSRLRPAESPQPLFAAFRNSEWMRRNSERVSGEIGRRWRLYIDDEPPRPKVLRATSWIMQRHPDFAIRAEFNGDLRASIMASLWSDEGAGESEAELARCCGGTVEEVRSVLPELERTERVARRDAVQGPRFVALVPKDHAERPGP